jgi:hypothetical protein
VTPQRLTPQDSGHLNIAPITTRAVLTHIKIPNAKNVSHPMQGDEIRALRRLQREQGLSSHL